MTFNSNRRIAGKWKGEGEVIAEAEDPNFGRKLDLITEGCGPFVKEHLPACQWVFTHPIKL
ncbi:MAG: hypothetical protein ACJ70U_02190 [Nitrososphaera sp.]